VGVGGVCLPQETRGVGDGRSENSQTDRFEAVGNPACPPEARHEGRVTGNQKRTRKGGDKE